MLGRMKVVFGGWDGLVAARPCSAGRPAAHQPARSVGRSDRHQLPGRGELGARRAARDGGARSGKIVAIVCGAPVTRAPISPCTQPPIRVARFVECVAEEGAAITCRSIAWRRAVPTRT